MQVNVLSEVHQLLRCFMHRFQTRQYPIIEASLPIMPPPSKKSQSPDTLIEATEKVQILKRQLKVLLNELSTAFLLYNRVIKKCLGGIQVISNQESLNFSPYMAIIRYCCTKR